MKRPRRRARVARRRAVGTLEVLVCLPIMTFALVGLFQIGLVVLFHAAVNQAAIEGAREAGKGATLAEVGDRVEGVLAIYCIDLTNGGGGTVILEDGDAAPTLVGTLGNVMPCSIPASPTIAAGEVRVTVCIDLDQVPCSDALGNYGVSFLDCTLNISSLVKKE